MKKHSFISLISIIAIAISASQAFSTPAPFDESGSVKVSQHQNDKDKIDTDNIEVSTAATESAEQASSSDAKKVPLKGTVTADELNIRTGPWGEIIGAFNEGDQIEIKGESGDWYIIDYNGTEAYVFKEFIKVNEYSDDTSIAKFKREFEDTSSSPSKDTENDSDASNDSFHQNIVQQARALLGSTDFRTPDVNYGRVACAKVVSTALNNAGAISEDEMSLDCYVLRDNLKAKGWEEVSAPPYKEGDVVFWSTYDWDGDGIIDEDTHVGIITKEGNNFVAINNSSDEATPIVRDINFAPVSRLLRKK